MTSDVGKLIQERLPQWRAYARSLTRNRAAADDLVQDTIVRVLTSIEHFDGSNFASWSNAILRNRFIDDCRRARFQNGSVDNLPVAATAQPATQAFAVELEETMRALHKLPPKHRKILVLIAVNELSYVRAARRLKIPLGTVRSRLARARATLLAAVDGNSRDSRNAEDAPTPMRSRCRRKFRSTRPTAQRALELDVGRSHSYHGATELA
jgi:RNA polymerase sigma-70 factor (ECF subfamily)